MSNGQIWKKKNIFLDSFELFFFEHGLTWDESAGKEKKIAHHFRQAFWNGKSVRYHQKKFKIGPLGDFEKSAFLYFHPSQYNLTPGIKGATDLYGPKWPFMTLNDAPMKSLHDPKCPFMTQNVPA